MLLKFKQINYLLLNSVFYFSTHRKTNLHFNQQFLTDSKILFTPLSTYNNKCCNLYFIFLLIAKLAHPPPNGEKSKRQLTEWQRAVNTTITRDKISTFYVSTHHRVN